MAKSTSHLPARTGTDNDLFGLDWPRLMHWPDWAHRMAEGAIKLEEFDEDATHVVRAEMPGIDPDKDVEISVDQSVLTIRAERREEKKTEDRGRTRSEFSYGSFSRSVTLPPGASEDDVKATYHDGILEIRFPIDADVASARKIPVTRG